MSDPRPGPYCIGTVLDERGDAWPCAKRPHPIGPHVALIVTGDTARVVWGGASESGVGREPVGGWAPESDDPQPFVRRRRPTRDQVEQARLGGYLGDSCGDCGAMTLLPNGSCKKCVTCGATTGCS